MIPPFGTTFNFFTLEFFSFCVITGIAAFIAHNKKRSGLGIILLSASLLPLVHTGVVSVFALSVALLMKPDYWKIEHGHRKPVFNWSSIDKKNTNWEQ